MNRHWDASMEMLVMQKPIDGMKAPRRRQRFGIANLRIAKHKVAGLRLRLRRARSPARRRACHTNATNAHPSPKTAATAQVTYLC